MSGLTPLLVQTFGLPPNIPELARRVLVRGFGEQTVEELLPMLDYASQMLQNQAGQRAAQMEQQEAAQAAAEGGINTEQGRAPEFQDPQAAAAQEAIVAGQNQGTGIGPISPQNFNRNVPNEGAQAGEAS